MTDPGSPLIVALDFSSLDLALRLVGQLDPRQCRLKVGKELFTVAGPAVLEQLQRRGFQVFLDLKFHDIPNTTAAAVRAAAGHGVWMINVHASGGREMLEAAAAAREECKVDQRPILIAVTVLTSLDAAALKEMGISDPLEAHVGRLASLAHRCGIDGVVCSARESTHLRRECGPDFVLVTPGIRPTGSGVADQRRTMTPQDAIRRGSNYLVIGRPITASDEPAAVVQRILSEISYRPTA